MSKKKNKNKMNIGNALDSNELSALNSLKVSLTNEENKVKKEDAKKQEEEYKEKFMVKVSQPNYTRKNRDQIKEISKTDDLGKFEKVNPEAIMTNLLQMQVDAVNDMITKLNDQLCYVELIQVDIYHLIENLNFSAAEGYDLAKALQIVLKRRREIKDDIASLKSLNDKLMEETTSFIDMHSGLVNRINRAEQKNAKDMLEKYNFRVLENANIKVKHIRCMVDELLNKEE